MRDRAERRTLKALRQGRREAYVEVVDTHYRSVYRFLLFLGGDAHLAEDLTQEVFASAWRSLDGFRGDSSIRTWLHRIAYHAFLDAQRRRERDKTLAGALSGCDCDVADDPLAGIVADECVSQVALALQGLDLDERTALLLHYVDGQSYREMARTLRRPNGTVKWITSRALENLRKRLAGKVEP
ncbi:MAG: RNA polymerase sigma factor [Phycisphaerae bacterium]|nr:RNA polymerase sigma factor [Phycisphaerae bacterium]